MLTSKRAYWQHVAMTDRPFSVLRLARTFSELDYSERACVLNAYTASVGADLKDGRSIYDPSNHTRHIYQYIIYEMLHNVRTAPALEVNV